MPKFLHLTKAKTKHANSAGILKLIGEFKSLKLICVFAVAFFAVGYFIQINSLSTKGYEIRELQGRIDELKQEKSDLELEALSLQSMGTIRDKLAQADMVKSENSDYLAPTPVAYAR